MATKYAPWVVRAPRTDGHAFDVFDSLGTKLHHGYWGGEADAHLIAAAPDLLDALKGLVEHPDTVALGTLVDAAQAAIAKAEGRDV